MEVFISTKRATDTRTDPSGLPVIPIEEALQQNNAFCVGSFSYHGNTLCVVLLTSMLTAPGTHYQGTLFVLWC